MFKGGGYKECPSNVFETSQLWKVEKELNRLLKWCSNLKVYGLGLASPIINSVKRPIYLIGMESLGKEAILQLSKTIN